MINFTVPLSITEPLDRSYIYIYIEKLVEQMRISISVFGVLLDLGIVFKLLGVEITEGKFSKIGQRER